MKKILAQIELNPRTDPREELNVGPTGILKALIRLSMLTSSSTKHPTNSVPSINKSRLDARKKETDRNGDTWGQQTASGGRDSIEDEKRMYGKRHTSRATERLVSSSVGPGQYWLWSNGLQPMTRSRLGSKQGFPLAHNNRTGSSCWPSTTALCQLTQIDKETGDKSHRRVPLSHVVHPAFSRRRRR